MQSEERILQRLKWIAILGPLLFLTAIEALRYFADSDLLRAWPGYVLIAGVVLIATLFFAEAMFGVIGRMQERLHRQNRELIALHDAGLSITSELDLERVLQRVVDVARDLGGARYGALSLLGESGRIEAFLTSGLSNEARARIGPIPQGHGLLAAVIEHGAALRIPDLTQDPRSVGFPPEHPPMHSLLAVPVRSHGKILGSFYLTEKVDAPEFTQDDLQRLERFATQAAVAIENANLHRRVQMLAVTEERERIAREMHDTVAQVLGYVNIKAQAAEEHLSQGETARAGTQIAQLSSAARDAYSDLREAILGLRTSLNGERGFLDGLGDYLRQWENQSQISPELVVDLSEGETLDIAPLAELQVLRIIQESLSNVRKHAKASRARISIQQRPAEIVVTIEDDGRGFDQKEILAREFPRFGLSTMKERAEAIQGALEIDSLSGVGTTVSLRIPRASRRTSGIETQ